MIALAIVAGVLALLALFACEAADQVLARRARGAGAWLRRDHPPLVGAARAELQVLVAEQYERVRRALEPLPQSKPEGLDAMREVYFQRRSDDAQRAAKIVGW